MNARSMPNLLVFTPNHELEFQRNYDDFIAFAKNELTLFSDHEFNGRKGWECDKWSWFSARGKRLSILFGIGHNSSQYTPYEQTYADFAKAYVRYELSLKHKNSRGWVYSLQWLYRALVEQAEQNNKSRIDIMDLRNSTINRTEELIRTSDLSLGTKWNLGRSLENVLSFLKEMRFKLDLQDWKSPFRNRPATHKRVDRRSRAIELDKCPSDYQMLQVAEAFHRAETPRQKYFTSLCVMLMCQPSRSIELSGLTTHSLQQSEKGRWYLMWYPAKGGDPVRKWIPKLLEDVVRQAFERLVEISAPARAAAKFAYDHPDQFMMHDECITLNNFPQDKPLTHDQFAKAMGLRAGRDKKGTIRSWRWQHSQWLDSLISDLNGVPDWRELIPEKCVLAPNNEILQRVRKQIGQGFEYRSTNISIRFPSYSDLVKLVNRQYRTEAFPFYGDVPLWESICLVRDYEFNKIKPVKPFSWVAIGFDAISSAIGKPPAGSLSIFEELNITDEGGSPLKLTTHQFRHWLNTKLMLSGEEDWLIAKWSGRADIKQNKAYDGRTQAQKSRLTKRIGPVVKSNGVNTVAEANKTLTPFTSDSPPPPIVLHDLALPVSLKSLGVKRNGVAQFTGLGFCVHNYAESPCVKNGDCATCSEHVCLKGVPNTLDELKNLEKLHEEQLAHAQASAEENIFGADRWVTSLGFKLSKLKTIIAMLEDPNAADGTQVRVPDELDVSPVKRSLNIDEANVIPTLDFKSLALQNLED